MSYVASLVNLRKDLHHTNRSYDNIEKLMSSISSGKMSGYKFIDNSGLSVCESIKQYFEKNLTSAYMDSSNSSSSSGSMDLDASFQKVLFANRLKHIRHQLNVSNVDAYLCSEAIESVHNKRKTVNLISFSGSIENEKLMDFTTHSKPHLTDDLIDDRDNDWWRRYSDESFERDEAMCASILHDETQIYNVEAPSSLWDQSIYPMEESVKNWKSTINSESSREFTQCQPNVMKTNIPSKGVLLKPTVLLSNSDPKTGTISSSNSQLLESDVHPTTKSYYRPSMMNVLPLPDKKKRNYFFTDLSDTSEALLQKESTKAPFHQLSLFEKRPPVSKHSSALPVCHENRSANFSNNLSSDKPDFNDTLEEVEYLIDKGKQLQQQSTTPAPTPPLLLFSPKSNIKNFDTIRLNLNLNSKVNEATSPIDGTSIPSSQRIGEIELMARRSVNKSFNDSYWD